LHKIVGANVASLSSLAIVKKTKLALAFSDVDNGTQSIEEHKLLQSLRANDNNATLFSKQIL
jgi:hypothetical protein